MGTVPIFLQILLRKPHRTPRDIAGVREALVSLGIQPTASGAATISASISADLFHQIFGDENAATLPVPDSVREMVESITIAPRPEYYE
jgi:hypothetical protein